MRGWPGSSWPPLVRTALSPPAGPGAGSIPAGPGAGSIPAGPGAGSIPAGPGWSSVRPAGHLANVPAGATAERGGLEPQPGASPATPIGTRARRLVASRSAFAAWPTGGDGWRAETNDSRTLRPP
ncbi:MAG: hypothetical protein FJW90_04230 [Actinobacteria bacterium]|nr:hypothetical protein [Actinomycetota bacterium]